MASKKLRYNFYWFTWWPLANCFVPCGPVAVSYKWSMRSPKNGDNWLVGISRQSQLYLNEGMPCATIRWPWEHWALIATDQACINRGLLLQPQELLLEKKEEEERRSAFMLPEDFPKLVHVPFSSLSLGTYRFLVGQWGPSGDRSSFFSFAYHLWSFLLPSLASLNESIILGFSSLFSSS